MPAIRLSQYSFLCLTAMVFGVAITVTPLPSLTVVIGAEEPERTVTTNPAPRIALDQQADRVCVTLNGEPLTEFRFHKDLVHGPVLFPLRGPGGVPLTRSWPVGPLLPGDPRTIPTTSRSGATTAM